MLSNYAYASKIYTMNSVSKIKNMTKSVFRRAKHDDLLYFLLEIGAASFAITFPHIATAAIFIKIMQEKKSGLSKNQLRSSYYYFKKQGWINVESEKGRTGISLTSEGERKAGLIRTTKMLANKLSEKNKWDGYWRIVIFDLRVGKDIERNAIRALLKRCGFIMMQRSVWIYPYDCSKEIEFVSSFFKLTDQELRLIVCRDIGDSYIFEKAFHIF